MKKTFTLYFSLLAFVTSFSNADASGSWLQKASYSGAARRDLVTFTIGHYAYAGCGFNGSYLNDFYRWDQNTNTWSAIASYPGNGQDCCIGFTIEGKGYVGFGSNGTSRSQDLWRYDSATNAWTQMANFPGSSRYSQGCFVVGHKAWMICGSTGGPPYLQDVWMYDAHQNSWTQMANYPGGQLEGILAFTIGSHGYALGGYSNPNSVTGFWEYDTANDNWKSLPAFPYSYGVCVPQAPFVLGQYVFVCIGGIPNQYVKLGYQYDTASHTWSTFTNMGADGLERSYGAAFSLNGYGYICMGLDSTSNLKNDLWQWTPPFFGFANVISDATQVNLYPNPNNGIFSFAYSGLETGKNELKITNILGQEMNIYTVKGKEGKLNIDEGDLQSGIYLYQLVNGNRVIGSGRFVVAK